jgi:TolA-binding protein
MPSIVAVYRRTKGIHVPGYVGMVEYNRAQQRITQLETQLASMNDVIATMQSTIEELVARLPATEE